MANRSGDPSKDRHFPISAGILFGLGLGGFFDGIVLHQLVQWHHVLSSWYPVNTIENLELNTRWDGIFHSATYLFVVAALFILWRTAQRGAGLRSRARPRTRRECPSQYPNRIGELRSSQTDPARA